MDDYEIRQIAGQFQKSLDRLAESVARIERMLRSRWSVDVEPVDHFTTVPEKHHVQRPDKVPGDPDWK